jgi:glucosamine--fructose-6-phosphate aminotransferase (isomerizing)
MTQYKFVLNEASPLVQSTLSQKDIVIVLSHRGTKQYSSMALEQAKQTEATTVLVTSVGSLASVEQVDFVFHTSTGEKSSAFTESHTCALSTLLLVAVELGTLRNTKPAKAISTTWKHDLVNLVRESLTVEDTVKHWITQQFQTVPIAENRLFFVGNGPNASTAYEVALKLKETCYINCEGFQLEQYLHGPFCATNVSNVVTYLVVPPDGNSTYKEQRYNRTVQLVESAIAVKAEVAIVTQKSDPLIQNDSIFSIVLPDMPELFTPIVYLVPLQLLTYWLSLDHPELKTNPDVFRMNDPLHASAKTKYTTF